MEHDTFLYLIWWLDRRLLIPFTHRRTGPQRWTPRRFTPKWLAAHPWLWCSRCSDGLTTWREVRRGLCEVCSSDRWLDAALDAAAAAGDPWKSPKGGDAGLHETHRLTVIRSVGPGWANLTPTLTGEQP